MTPSAARTRGVGPVVVVVAVIGVLVGCARVPEPVPPAGPALPAGPLPTSTLMPYVDVTADTLPDLRAVGDETGQRDFVLAFALATGGACRPRWGGDLPIDAPPVTARAADARAAGGRITVATGGAQGPYLENACPDATTLAAAYGTVLDAVGADGLDVDVEADVPVDRVVRALATVQRERATPISVTLPVVDAGTVFSPSAMTLLRALAAAGVAVRVNVMVMNFPDDGAGWAPSMLTAGETAARRLGEVWPGADPAALRRRVALTLMIGRNDQGMVTTLADAVTVAGTARARGVGAVGMWSVARDDGCPDETTARPDCSGVDQPPGAFLRGLHASFVAS